MSGSEDQRAGGYTNRTIPGDAVYANFTQAPQTTPLSHLLGRDLDILSDRYEACVKRIIERLDSFLGSEPMPSDDPNKKSARSGYLGELDQKIARLAKIADVLSYQAERLSGII